MGGGGGWFLNEVGKIISFTFSGRKIEEWSEPCPEPQRWLPERASSDAVIDDPGIFLIMFLCETDKNRHDPVRQMEMRTNT